MKALVPVANIPQLHTTPLAAISVRDSEVRIEVDDADENRGVLVFGTYQAVRVTTADCFDPPDDLSGLPTVAMEVVQSGWIEDLRSVLRRSDESATFLDNARHFVVPLQDDFAEVVAWDIRWESL
jgi:hypothetical protein